VHVTSVDLNLYTKEISDAKGSWPSDDIEPIFRQNALLLGSTDINEYLGQTGC
jgi:hypothetical protein